MDINRKEFIDYINTNGKTGNRERYRKILDIDIIKDKLSVKGELYFNHKTEIENIKSQIKITDSDYHKEKLQENLAKLTNDYSDKFDITYSYKYSLKLSQIKEFMVDQNLTAVLLNFKCKDSENRNYKLDKFFGLDYKHGTEMFYLGTYDEIRCINWYFEELLK